ncbi:MAG: serine hydrolase [Gammaproteobacteria bacterium]|nr:serine hydrolase [Gammaproteobacteria bacterium]
MGTRRLRNFSILILFATSLVTLPAASDDLKFSAAHQSAAQLPRLHSLLISHRGELVFEQYYNGRDRYQPGNLKSASKSVISALVGIAIEQGLINGVQQPISDFFPEYRVLLDSPAKQDITIEDLLTMRSGLETTSNRNYGKWVLSDDWIRFVLSQPMVGRSGEQMIYSTGSTHLLSAILSKVSGMDTRRFAEQNLAAPMGFSMAYWSQDPQGIYFGGNNMEMTPRNMLAFGQLYLNQGQFNEQQIISPHWVSESHKAHATSPRGQGRFYGYGWWLRELADMLVPVAWGYGGQLIFVVKEYELVVVATSDSTPGLDRRGHLRRLYQLTEEQILWPVKRAEQRFAEN